MLTRGQEHSGYLMIGSLVLLTLLSFVLQSSYFTSEFRPDEWRSAHVFLTTLAGSTGLAAEFWTRALLLIFNLGCVAALWSARLISRGTLILALIWPLTLFLFSKIYWEFYVFPLCLVRPDLRRIPEVLFIGFLFALYWVTGEANLIVILVWRGVLLLQKLGRRWSGPLALIFAGLALDQMMQSGRAEQIPLIGEALARFTWTRDIVNPEYSIVETAAVFFTSFHFFSLHDGVYWINAAFSTLVILTITWSVSFWTGARRHADLILAFLAVVIFFTSITHAFQNARYYFFFLPVLAALVPQNRLLLLAVIGPLHVLVHGVSL